MTRRLGCMGLAHKADHCACYAARITNQYSYVLPVCAGRRQVYHDIYFIRYKSEVQDVLSWHCNLLISGYR